MVKDFYDWLEASLPILTQKQAVIGFDGSIDRLASIQSMETMSDLSAYLASREGMSGALEMHQNPPKIGGNMPITANALGQLGLKSDCIGAIDDPLFAGVSKNCTLHPVAPPCTCLALEFKAGKLMLIGTESVKTLNFASITAKLGKGKLQQIYSQADLCCFLNWSELPGMTDILCGLQHMVSDSAVSFFDLADFSERKPDEVKEYLSLIGKFKESILSLNENETNLLMKLYKAKDMDSLYKILKVKHLVIRTNHKAHAISSNGIVSINTLYVKNPRLLTGAGDNFNAGIAAALLMGGNWQQALSLGTLVSSYYIENGYSPDLNGLLYAAKKFSIK